MGGKSDGILGTKQPIFTLVLSSAYLLITRFFESWVDKLGGHSCLLITLIFQFSYQDAWTTRCTKKVLFCSGFVHKKAETYTFV